MHETHLMKWRPNPIPGSCQYHIPVQELKVDSHNLLRCKGTRISYHKFPNKWKATTNNRTRGCYKEKYLPNSTTPVSSIGQQKFAYPEQSDKIGNFSGTTRLILKDDAEPFIDPYPTQIQYPSKKLNWRKSTGFFRRMYSGKWKDTQTGVPVCPTE